MVAEVFAGISAFKSMLDIAKSIKNMNDVATRQAAVIELHEQILSAQAAQAQLVETVGDLKKRIAELEDWEAEKQRYELKELATGVFAYRLKESMAGSEPTHNLCAACYRHGRTSILQRRDRGMELLMGCSECKSEIKIGDAKWSAMSTRTRPDP